MIHVTTVCWQSMAVAVKYTFSNSLKRVCISAISVSIFSISSFFSCSNFRRACSRASASTLATWTSSSSSSPRSLSRWLSFSLGKIYNRCRRDRIMIIKLHKKRKICTCETYFWVFHYHLGLVWRLEIKKLRLPQHGRSDLEQCNVTEVRGKVPPIFYRYKKVIEVISYIYLYSLSFFFLFFFLEGKGR